MNRVLLATAAAGLFFSCCSPAQETAAADAAHKPHPEKTRPGICVLIVGKAKAADPIQQQKRGTEAVRMVADAAKQLQPETVIHAFSENIMTRGQYRRGDVKEKITRTIFRKHLKRLAKNTKPQDTVVIYTHTHGSRNGFEKSQPLGGIVLDLPVRRTAHRGRLLWNEYADLLLEIPAKNVVVLTMSCFSGGLAEYLDSPQVKPRWEKRRSKQGRNLIVLTSQNKDMMSPPIVKHGEVINPFTYAVTKAFAGAADGFNLQNSTPGKPNPKDGRITAGELIDYIRYTTENTPSENKRRRNIAKPQLTGSFSREDVLFDRTGSKGPDPINLRNKTQ